MNKILYVCIVIVFIPFALLIGNMVSYASAAPQAQGYSLSSAVVFDTREYPADSKIRTMIWRNDTGGTIYIRKAYLWIGMYRGALADSDATVMRLSDGVLVAKMQWDHYADPAAPSSNIFNFDPGYITLEAGDGLALTYYTNPIVEQPPFKAAAQVIIWWSKE